MKPAHRLRRGQLGRKRLKAGLWASGLLLVGQGCSQLAGSSQPPAPFGASPVQGAMQAADGPPVQLMRPAAGDVRQVAAVGSPQASPAAADEDAAAPAPRPVTHPGDGVAANHQLPIGLDTVLRLAEEQNPQIAIARERVREAFAEKDVAASKWLPDVYLGMAYYRHEGGIQNEDGTLTHSSFGSLFGGMEVDGRLDIRDVAYQQVNAQRKVWQQKGELSRVTSETLLDAANTYVDLLTARTGEAIAHDLEAKLRGLLERAQKLASAEPVARVEVARIQAALDAEQQAVVKLRGQAAAAAAKLIYLLGLDPCAELVPVDSRLVAFDLVDATPPTCDLVAQALANGPGVREMEGLLTLIQDSIARSQGASQYLPIFEVRMAEGAFGAGPGDSLTWDNRWDLGLQARWNLTEAVTARDRRRVTASKVQQLHLNYQDLRGKLTAGVQEARGTILSGRDQIPLAEAQVSDSRRAYELSDERLRLVPQSSSYSESLLSIDAMARAQLAYLNAISSYDKAQLRLMVLLGPSACQHFEFPSSH
jgi:outer membrane protein TolC